VGLSLTVLCFKPHVLYEMLAANQEQDSGSYEFGRDIIPMMMERGCRVFGYKFRGYWGYTRTIDEYWQTSMDLLGPAPRIDMEAWGLRTNLEHRAIRDCQPLIVGKRGVLDNSMAYNGVVVEGEAHNSILFPGVRIEPGAIVRDSVLFFNTVVRRGARIDRVVCDVNSSFGPDSRVGQAEGAISVIGWNNQVPAGMRIGAGCTIYPRIDGDHWPAAGLADGEVLQ